MAIIFVTGFEHGLISDDGNGLYESIPFPPTNCSIATDPVRTGSRVLNVHPAASAEGLAVMPPMTAQATYACSFAIRFETLATSDHLIFAFRSVTVTNISLYYDFSTGRIGVCGDTPGAVTTESWTDVILADTWYYFDLLSVRSGGGGALSGRYKRDGDLNFKDLPDVTVSGATATTAQIELGRESPVDGSAAFDVYYDDVVIANSASDWPLGDHRVIPIQVGSDGTHSFTNNDFSTGDAGTVRAQSYTDFNLMLDELPWDTARSTTDNVAQRVVRTAGYVEVAPRTDQALTNRRAAAVRALLSYSSSGAAANTGKCEVRNSAGTAVELWGIFPSTTQDYSEIDNFFKGAIVTEPAAGWTETEIQAIRWRLGGSSDVVDIPTWQALMLEVAYLETGKVRSDYSQFPKTKMRQLQRAG